ncbi:MAG: hypothetical protein ACI35O_16880 [Bacillaceae bacterium]
MSFFKPKKNSSGGGLTEITEADLPISVRQKLNQIAELKETVENLENSDGGGDIDLGTF